MLANSYDGVVVCLAATIEFHESGSEVEWRILALNPIREKKNLFLRFANYFAFIINGFGCGYARFQGAVQAFSEHQKNRKKIDKSMGKLNFSARPLENLGKYMDFDWNITECGCITVQKPLEISEYLYFNCFFQDLGLKFNFLSDLSKFFRFFGCSEKVWVSPLKRT